MERDVLIDSNALEDEFYALKTIYEDDFHYENSGKLWEGYLCVYPDLYHLSTLTNDGDEFFVGQILETYSDVIRYELKSILDLDGLNLAKDNVYTETASEKYQKGTKEWISLLDTIPNSGYEFCIAYDQYMKNQEFQKEEYKCSICMETKLGLYCYKFDHCNHVFCKACLCNYYKVLIKDGMVEAVCCPHSECRNKEEQAPYVPFKDMADLAGSAAADQYRNLLEKHQVDHDPSRTWCPITSCQNPATRDKDIYKLAICQTCSFAFCSFCSMTWHGEHIPCRINDREAMIKKYMDAKENDSQNTIKELELRHGKRVLEKLEREFVENKQNQEWVKAFATSCPSCDLAIVKSDGCNHMKCYSCGTHFCYVCGEYLSQNDPYSHFNSQYSPCYRLLFSGIESVDEENEVT
ncbi:hypothetical protein H4219_002933 [Mycoemilia scoparia]|uniref:RBR-type E3 ubiquitin transferase n=1 Tax=Mycoemilia scoparia TaxID=417184 RepID=A0A9W8A008_9FUNG|nr:hypothetical protein H4219_002933 [Mycoemilia scoparia]